MFGGNLALVAKDAVNVNDAGGQNGEKETKSEDNGVSDTDAQGCFTAEEGVLELILEERGESFGTKAHRFGFGWDYYKSSNVGNVFGWWTTSINQAKLKIIKDRARKETKEKTQSCRFFSVLCIFRARNRDATNSDKISEGLVGVGPSGIQSSWNTVVYCVCVL